MNKYGVFLLVALLIMQPAFAMTNSSAQDMINYQKELKENLARQINQTKAEMQKILDQINQTKAEVEKQKQLIESQKALKKQLEEQRQKELMLKLQASIETQKEDINRSLSELKIKQNEIYESYLKTKIAAVSLAVANQSLNEIPENISMMASEINVSLDGTFESEKNIAQRNFIVRAVLGGDKQSASQIEEAVAKNNERISAIEKALQNTSYNEAIKALLETQLKILKDEQERLLKLAEEEKKSQGLIGWLWK